MLLHHRHLVVYCGLSIVSPLVLCYLPCNILINIIADLFMFQHLVYCGLDIVSPLGLCSLPCNILLNIITEPFLYVPPPRHLVFVVWTLCHRGYNVPLCDFTYSHITFGSFPFVIALLFISLVPPSASCLLWIQFMSGLRLPPKLLGNLLRKKNEGVSEEFTEEMEEKLKDIFICKNELMALNGN